MDIYDTYAFSKEAQKNQAFDLNHTKLINVQENTFISVNDAVPAFTNIGRDWDEDFCTSRPVLILFHSPTAPNQKLTIAFAQYFASAEDGDNPYFRDMFSHNQINLVEAWCYLNHEDDEDDIPKPMPLEAIEKQLDHVVAFNINPDFDFSFGTPYFPMLYKDREAFAQVDQSDIYACMPLPSFDHIESAQAEDLIFD